MKLDAIMNNGIRLCFDKSTWASLCKHWTNPQEAGELMALLSHWSFPMLRSDGGGGGGWVLYPSLHGLHFLTQKRTDDVPFACTENERRHP